MVAGGAAFRGGKEKRRRVGNPYGLKDATGMGMTADMGAAWGTAALQPAATGYYPYDPTLAAYGSFDHQHNYYIHKHPRIKDIHDKVIQEERKEQEEIEVEEKKEMENRLVVTGGCRIGGWLVGWLVGGSRYGAGYDLAARRKNATRESTATLKAWLNEHKKNPYPTKGEKIMLAIITKMTLTQVSTWFANARRRLKKENKMTWEPKNKTDDDDDAVLTDSEDNKEKDDLANDNRGDRVGEDARRGLDDNGKATY
ncbi:hypothetical protein HZH68_015076 [Vespula germanica]|uniref:Homeobox domain-containing protein n=1 Tax=Vespula germanica TaxID=30212 RepID=A0A834J880_VESGE|nr:hypothetical protein HZH68_015076 [Vespula germanica]